MITVTMAGIVSLVVALLVAGAIFGLLFLLVNTVPIPEPYKGWILIILKVLAILFAIGVLLNFAGFPIVRIQ